MIVVISIIFAFFFKYLFLLEREFCREKEMQRAHVGSPHARQGEALPIRLLCWAPQEMSYTLGQMPAPIDLAIFNANSS